MFVQSLRYSLNKFSEKVVKNFLVLILLFIFSVALDFSRDVIAASGETPRIIHALVEAVGTCLLYSLILNELLGIKKFNILNFFTYLRVNILYSVSYFIGAVFLIFPGFYLLTFFFFAPILALEGKEEEGYFKQSKSLVKKSPWSVFGIGITLLLIMIIDFLIMGLFTEASTTKYFMIILSNLLVVLLDLYLFIATVFIYRKLSSK